MAIPSNRPSTKRLTNIDENFFKLSYSIGTGHRQPNLICYAVTFNSGNLLANLSSVLFILLTWPEILQDVGDVGDLLLPAPAAVIGLLRRPRPVVRGRWRSGAARVRGGGGGKDWPPPGPMPLPTPTRSRSGVLSVGSSLTMLSSSDDDSRNKEGFVEIIVIFTAFGSCKQMMLLYMLPLNPIAGQTGSS